MNTTPRIALVAGSTGLVGTYLLNTLLEAPDYARVYALTRRPTTREHSRLAYRTVVWDRMAEQLKGLSVQDAYCTIGTTRKAAGSAEAVREVDVDAVVTFARAARAVHATRFVVVSSVGADAASKHSYLRSKAEMEAAVTGLGFQSVDILQPSLMSGARKEFRPGEIAGRIFAPLVNPLLTGSLEQYRVVPAETVAKAMLGAARRGTRGVYRYTYSGICQLAEMRAPQPGPAQTAKKTVA